MARLIFHQIPLLDFLNIDATLFQCDVRIASANVWWGDCWSFVKRFGISRRRRWSILLTLQLTVRENLVNLVKMSGILLWASGLAIAKLIEIQQIYLQERHGLHERGGLRESSNTPHESKCSLHQILEPKISKFGSIFLLKSFFVWC